MTRHIAVAFAAAILVSAPARGEYGLMNLPVWCEVYPGVTNILDRDHQERVYGTGAASGGYLVELYVAPSTDTWTLVQTDPARQRQCAFRSGEGWQFVIPAPASGGNF
jgi:hypothetical protein